jgi:hypothetical protein
MVAALAAWGFRTIRDARSAIGDAKPSTPVAAGGPTHHRDLAPLPIRPQLSTADVPAGATAISGDEITAALSDHTAVMPGGFVEYYAPDGTLHGMVEEKRYGGTWEVRNGAFCTLLEGSDGDVCSPVERAGKILYWSMDGEQEVSPVIMMKGNPRNLH